MTEAIGEMISQCFYEGRLESRGPEPFPIILGCLQAPITWWSTSSKPKRYERRVEKSFSNPVEVTHIHELFKNLKFAEDGGGLPHDLNQILVIAPYTAQVLELQRRLRGVIDSFNNVRVEINSIDAVQGRESDLVIFSPVRSNSDNRVGFLNSDKRINVALSRAKRGLIIVGDHKFLATTESPFEQVIKYMDVNSNFCCLEEL